MEVLSYPIPPPPLRLRRSRILSVDRTLYEPDSTYVFSNDDRGMDQAWSLVERIIELEKEEHRNSLSGLAPDFDDAKYRKRVKSKLMRAFDGKDEGEFHMQKDLEDPLHLTTNMGWSKFTRAGGVVFFSLRYFSPSLQKTKEGIEGELGLERKVEATIERTRYSRVGRGKYFRIPLGGYFRKSIHWTSDEDVLAQHLSAATSPLNISGRYSLIVDGCYSLELKDQNGNTYKFSLRLANIIQNERDLHSIGLGSLCIEGGTLIGTAVSDFEIFSKEHLSDRSEEEFKKMLAERFMGLADAKTDDIIAMPLGNNATAYLHLKDPIFQREISLKKINDYCAAKGILESQGIGTTHSLPAGMRG